jgi:hypothetical protein
MNDTESSSQTFRLDIDSRSITAAQVAQRLFTAGLKDDAFTVTEES